MKSHMHRSWLWVWALALVLALAAACAPAQAPRGAADGMDTQQPPKYGGTLRVRNTQDPPNLDPHLSSVAPTTSLVNRLYNTLLRYDAGPNVDPDANAIVGDLAKRWEVSPDAKTFTFYLHEGVKWHNVPPVNGRELDADDIVYSIKREADRKKPYGYLYADLESVEKVDKYTFRLTLKRPNAWFLDAMADPHTQKVPRETEQLGDLKNLVIGTGPFMLESLEKSIKVVMKRNPDYFKQGLPYLDKVEQLIIPDEQTATAAFRAAQFDLYSVDTPSKEKVILATRPELKTGRTGQFVWNHVALNQAYKPWNDIRVRKALNLATNREELLNVLFEGDGAISSVLPGGFTGWALSQEEIKKLYPYNPDQAKKLLAEAGFSSGLSVNILVRSGGDVVQKYGEMLASQWPKAGVQVKLDFVDYATHIARRADKDYEVAVFTTTPFPTADQYFFGLYYTDQPRNYGNVNDPELNKLIDPFMTEPDEKKRQQMSTEIQRYLANKPYNVPLIMSYSHNLWYPYVKNYRPSRAGSNGADKYAWLDK